MSAKVSYRRALLLAMIQGAAIVLAAPAMAAEAPAGGSKSCRPLASTVGWNVDMPLNVGPITVAHWGFKVAVEAGFQCGQITSVHVGTHDYGMTEIKTVSEHRSGTEEIASFSIVPHLPWVEWSDVFNAIKELLVTSAGAEAVAAIRSNGSSTIECARAANVYLLNKHEWIGGRWVNCTQSPYIYEKS